MRPTARRVAWIFTGSRQRARRAGAPSPRPRTESREVQEFREGAAHFLLESLGENPQVFSKQLVVPSEYLVNQDVAVRDEPTDTCGQPHAQRERVAPHELRRDR